MPAEINVEGGGRAKFNFLPTKYIDEDGYYFDYEFKEKRKAEDNPEVVEIIVKVLKNNRYKKGLATKNPLENITFTDKAGLKRRAISKDIFPPDTLAWDNIRGIYYYTQDKDEYLKTKLISKYMGGFQCFPYSFHREYAAVKNTKLFEKYKATYTPIYTDEYKKLLPYSFGIEYETSQGVIPEELCFKAGMIPLRDGSITGNEYATIPMTSSDGFERIKYQLELLKEYTRFNKDCSLHIHFGGIPLEEEYILALYNLCYYIQYEISPLLPAYTFNSHLYKANGKDYCSLLQGGYNNFSALYKALGGGSYLGSLTQGHPADPQGEAKWNIKSRYLWVNFVNACFYNRNKTIEFRFLRPTTNFHKIVNWIFVFEAILEYAKKIAVCYREKDTAKALSLLSEVTLLEMFQNAYPELVVNSLVDFTNQLTEVTQIQRGVKDYIGSNTELEDGFITKDVLSV